MNIDEDRLQEFMGRAVTDMAAAMSLALMYIGDKLGLYKGMAGAGPMTSAALAEKTGTHERYIREWLSNNAAGGYVIYDPSAKTFTLPDEHAFALADDSSPVFLGGAFQLLAACWADADTVAGAFKSGKGVGWHEHDTRLFKGTERFFRPGYAGSLTTSWIPALEGIEAKLTAGAKVADVGCGHGASTIIMAKAYPNSSFVGFDYHDASIQAAREAAQAAGLSDRINFEVSAAKDFPGSDYDLICFFDCLHDMGDPIGAAKHAKNALSAEGTMMLVEPYANDNLEDNLNPVGRMFYGASTLVCTPASLSQEVGLALGAQAGEAQLAEVAKEAGFSRFRRAIETPFNLVLEARP